MKLSGICITNITSKSNIKHQYQDIRHQKWQQKTLDKIKNQNHGSSANLENKSCQQKATKLSNEYAGFLQSLLKQNETSYY